MWYSQAIVEVDKPFLTLVLGSNTMHEWAGGGHETAMLGYISSNTRIQRRLGSSYRFGVRDLTGMMDTNKEFSNEEIDAFVMALRMEMDLFPNEFQHKEATEILPWHFS